jgi:hypothetical protein
MSVASPVSVAKVRLYVDDRLLNQDYRSPYSFTWNTRSMAPGSWHTLKGIAYDHSGRQIANSTITVKLAGASLVQAQVAPPATGGGTLFADLSAGSPYAAAVATLAEAGVVSGYRDGNFGADNTITRTQVAKMVSLSLGLADQDTTQTPFRDLDEADADLYPHKFVAALYSIGAISGTSSTEFSPYAPVTRAQLIAILVRALTALNPEALTMPAPGTLSLAGDTGYADYTRSMTIAEVNGLLSGITGYGPSWDPWAPATRGELAQILGNLATID